ncbi:MAG: hypothetical protein IKY45_04005 [Clostridia bacterium]|nr:hypothetical protein [Clostridia bacterium]MBR4973610.1 hypothetical protein [Clostridia bacterium]
MPHYYGSEKTKCAFYKEETKNAIKCEGDFSESCTFNFLTATEKKRYKKQHCNNNYSDCPHFKRIINKYLG